MNEAQIDALYEQIWQAQQDVLADEHQVAKAANEARKAGRLDEADRLDRQFWLISGRGEGLHRALVMLSAARRTGDL